MSVMVTGKPGRPRKPDPTGKLARKRKSKLRANVVRLSQGTEILNYGDHHSAMAALKAELGDPRPKRCPSCGERRIVTLSLLKTTGPFHYLGYTRYGGQNVPYVLSVRPKDYRWECLACNARRGHPTVELGVATGGRKS